MKKENPKEFLTINNPYFQHFARNQRVYLSILILVFFFLLITINTKAGKPMLVGEESYYHIAQAHFKNPNPLYYVLKGILYISPNLAIIIPLLLSLGSLFLFYRVADKINLRKETTAVFLLFTIVSPFSIVSLASLSSYALLVFLLLAGFYILTFPARKKKVRYFALIPFAIIPFIDGLSAGITLIFLATFLHQTKKDKRPVHASLITTISSAVLNLFLNTPLLLGPFHPQNRVTDIFSDFGSMGGISFFLILLALIGFGLTWKQKKFYIAYALLPFGIIAYFINTSSAYIISLVAILFATVAFINIFKQKWVFPKIKNFAFLLLFLGLLFSTLSFIDRVPSLNPTAEDVVALEWMKANTDEPGFIFSTPENGPLIEGIANKRAFLQLTERNERKKMLTREFMTAGSSIEFFELLEENEVYLIYLNARAKEQFPDNKGLLVFLTDERFKLLNKTENTEIWKYTAE